MMRRTMGFFCSVRGEWLCVYACLGSLPSATGLVYYSLLSELKRFHSERGLSDDNTLVKMLTVVDVRHLRPVCVCWKCEGVGAAVTLHHNFLLQQLRPERLTSGCSISLFECVASGKSGSSAADFHPPTPLVSQRVRTAVDSLLKADRAEEAYQPVDERSLKVM